MAFAHSHDLGSLGDGKLVLQHAVEHLDPGLFLLIQRYIPHGDDIFAEQLAGDRIVDHQQRDSSPCDSILTTLKPELVGKFMIDALLMAHRNLV